MRIRCVAELYGVFKTSAETVLDEEKPRLASILGTFSSTVAAIAYITQQLGRHLRNATTSQTYYKEYALRSNRKLRDIAPLPTCYLSEFHHRGRRRLYSTFAVVLTKTATIVGPWKLITDSLRI
ncbi:hypothetical protein QTP88_003514 [Uroleucon formosanum]